MLLTMISTFIELADFDQLEIFVYWISQFEWAETKTHANLLSLVRGPHTETIELSATYTLKFFQLMS